MRPHRLVPALALVAVLVVGCSSSGGKHGSPAAIPSNDPAPVIAPVHDLAGLCTKMGGDFIEADGEHELGTSDQGSCSDDPTTLVYWFGSDTARDRWLSVALEAGGNYVIGPRWAIDVDDPQKAAFIAAQTGGQVRS